jgi:dienelactone hydrolase
MPRILSDFSQRGPFRVGALQTEIPSSNDPIEPGRRLPTEIWYPARAEPVTAPDAQHPLGLLHRASTGLSPHASPAPLVAFSHGNSGLRQQSTFLTTHLASWGFVVVAPDHVGNTFAEMLALENEEQRREVHLRARQQRPNDIAAAIRAVLDEGLERDRLPPVIADSVGVLGHSYGGWTSLKIPALENRTRAICCLAPASEPFVGRKAFEAHELPIPDSIETLVLAGRDDVLVDLDTSIRPLFDRLGPAAQLEILDGADHFHFCDGIELLHKMHENNPRPNQLHPTRALSELTGEAEMHAILNERVTRFFRNALGENQS